MAEIPQVLATYDALAGVALGAGLTYAFGALNRLHQEAREDKTRWYQARLDAYADFYRALSDWWLLAVRDQALRTSGRSSLQAKQHAWPHSISWFP
jgi:hypothetical protein